MNPKLKKLYDEWKAIESMMHFADAKMRTALAKKKKKVGEKILKLEKKLFG